jgi:hypothetical protein
MKLISIRRAALGITAAGALALLGAAAPALAQTDCGSGGCLNATVTVPSSITMTVSASALTYGTVAAGATGIPEASTGGTDAHGYINVGIVTNDPHGFNVTATAQDWTDLPSADIMPATSLSECASTTADACPSGDDVSLTEGTGAAGATVISMSTPVSATYSQLWSLAVPSTQAGGGPQYTTTVTEVATPA